MRFYVLLVCLSLSCVTFAQNEADKPYVLLVSFDGFRHDYVERFDLPNFKRFIKEGAAADGLIPSFPSKTFPNHYTIVTGLYPGNHGLVDNGFYDPEHRKLYAMKNRAVVTDSSFYGGTPLWQLAKMNGIKSASYFWVGSDLAQQNLNPDYYFSYDQSVPFDTRVDKIGEWLTMPERDRPHMITLYFSSPDTESHKYGPLAPETKVAVLRLDSLLGRMVDRIDSTRLPVNIILVSDHGMKELVDKRETYIFLDELVKKSNSVTVANGGTQAHVYTRDELQADSLAKVLARNAKDFSVIRRKDFPERWHYNNSRSGDILILANPGKYLVTGSRQDHERDGNQGGTFGVHGYDPERVQDMYGIFYARGPKIRSGKKIASFQNIHIYPFIANLLDVTPPKVDGKIAVLKPIIR